MCVLRLVSFYRANKQTHRAARFDSSMVSGGSFFKRLLKPAEPDRSDKTALRGGGGAGGCRSSSWCLTEVCRRWRPRGAVIRGDASLLQRTHNHILGPEIRSFLSSCGIKNGMEHGVCTHTHTLRSRNDTIITAFMMGFNAFTLVSLPQRQHGALLSVTHTHRPLGEPSVSVCVVLSHLTAHQHQVIKCPLWPGWCVGMCVYHSAAA